MIAAWTGKPGAGKSYSAVYLLFQALESGKLVVTNVPLAEDWADRFARSNAFRRLIPGRVARKRREYASRLLVIETLDELMHVRLRGEGEGRGVAVLDEAHRWLNARTWDADETGQALKRTDAVRRRLGIIQWFAEHRHNGFDVYLITQSLATVDSQVERLVEYHVQLRNLKNFRAGPVRPLALLPFPVFLAIWKWHDTAGAAVLRRQWFPLRRSIAGLYATHGLARAAEDDPAAVWLPADLPPGGQAQRAARSRPAPPPTARPADGHPHTAADAAPARTSPRSDRTQPATPAGRLRGRKGPQTVQWATLLQTTPPNDDPLLGDAVPSDQDDSVSAATVKVPTIPRQNAQRPDWDPGAAATTTSDQVDDARSGS